MTAGLTVYNGNAIQFATKYPALLVDRTNEYGYKNYILTFSADPAQPPAPAPAPSGGSTTSTIYIKLLSIYHGLRYIPAFETVTIGYGLGSSAGVNIWNEDALLSFNTSTPLPGTEVSNKLIFRADTQYLYIYLVRQAVAWNFGSGSTVYYPPSLAGAQLNINTQIFAMGLNDIPSIVL